MIICLCTTATFWGPKGGRCSGVSTIIFSFLFSTTRPGAKKISFQISGRKVCSRKCVLGFRAEKSRNLFSLFLCLCLCVCLSVCLSLCLFLPLSFYLSLSTSLFLPLSFYLSLSLSLYLFQSFVCLLVRPSIHTFIFLSFPLFLVSDSSFKWKVYHFSSSRK